MSLEATRELAGLLGVDQLELLRANRDRPWREESGVLAFASLRPGDVLRNPLGGEVEIALMGAGFSTLGSLPTTDEFTAQLQARLSQQTASVQQTIANETGVDTSNARVSQGVQSAGSLLQHGYDPNSKDDNANLVHAIAGGAALIPGAGTVLAGAVETLWAVGNVIACPVTDAFASIGFGTKCGAPPCSHTGNWTAAGILKGDAGTLPSMPTGSFASLAVPALATYAAQAANCKGGMPPGVIVDAVVALWNETHKGAPMPYLIPPLAVMGGAGAPLIIITWQSSNWAHTGGKDPYAYYGFGPVATIIRDGASATTAAVQPGPWTPFPIAPAPPGMTYELPRIVNLNTGPFVPLTTARKNIPLVLGVKSAPPAASAGLSTGGKVAVGVGVTAAAGAGAWWALGKPLTVQALKSAVDRLVHRL